jgi:hypothetical protein
MTTGAASAPTARTARGRGPAAIAALVTTVTIFPAPAAACEPRDLAFGRAA